MKLLAPFISFFHHWRSFGIRNAMWAALEMIPAVFMAILFQEDRTPRKLRVLRRRQCQSCFMRDATLDTCGTPGMTTKDGTRKHGCWCPLTLAILVRDKDCWMAEHGSDRWEGLQ